MHYQRYFKKKKIDQIIFYKKINWFLDIKSILYKNYSKKIINDFGDELVKNYKNIKINFNTKKNLKKVILKNNLKKIKKKDNKKIIDILFLIKKINLLNYFDYFIIQGSVASNDYINGWSDFDAMVVIKDDVLRDKKKLLKLREKLSKIYKKIRSFCRYQHHGFIFFTNRDLENYLNGYLPPQALKYNITLKSKKFIKFNIVKNKKMNISKNILIEKKKFYQTVLKKRIYDHHVISSSIPKIPFKSDKPHMFELFYQLGSILNIPILYLDCIGKSSHKKNSFKKFYKLIQNDFIKEFIQKHERIRENWKKYDPKSFKIPKKLISDLGQDYFEKCLKVYEILIKKIKKTNNLPLAKYK